MKPTPPSTSPGPVTGEISALISRLHETSQRLEELTSGQIDTVADAAGRTFVLRRAQEDLRQIESKRQAAILDALPAHIALLDAGGIVVSVNEGWRRFADANRLEVPAYGIGLDYLAICDHASREASSSPQQAADAIRAILAGGRGKASIEYPCDSPTEKRWFLMTATPLSAELRGGAVVMHLDVTERKRAEEILRQVSHRVVDTRQKQIRVELLILMAATVAFFGLSLRFNWFEGARAWISAHAPSEMDEIIFTLVFLVTGLVVFTFRRWQESESELSTREKSQAVMGLLRDELERRVTQRTEELGRANETLSAEIAERERSEQAAAKALERLSEAQRVGQIGDWEWDLATKVISWSPQVYEVLGRDPRLGPPSLLEHNAIYDAESQRLLTAKVALAIESGEPQDYELRGQRSNGEPIVVLGRAAPRQDEAGRVVGLHGTVQDISKLKRAEDALRGSAEQLKLERGRLLTAQQVAKVGSWETDLSTRSVVWSEETHRIFQTDSATFHPTHSAFLGFVHPDDRALVDGTFVRSLDQGSPSAIEHRVLLADGRIKFVEERWQVQLDELGKPVRAIGTCQDITERKITEERIVHLSRVQAMLSGISSLIVRVRDRQELFKEACRIAVEAGGFHMSLIAVADPELKRIIPVASAGKDDGLLSAINSLLSEPELAPQSMLARAIRKKKAIVSNDSRVDPRVLLGRFYTEASVRSIAVLPLIIAEEAVGVLALYSSAVEVFRDDEMKLLTELADDIAFGLRAILAHAERERADEALRSSLKDKEALLKEVHHRVKNNMQVITSLLRLESNRIDHPTTRSVLKDMQNRIQAMAALHEAVYRSDNFSQVDLGVYLRQLTGQLGRSLVTVPGQITFRLDLFSVALDLDQAIPCGLIVNELVSNALKHAFPGGRQGEVRIELEWSGEEDLRLRITDNGIGLPPDFDVIRAKSLGLQLVSDLARQLDGSLRVGPGPEALFEVTFSPNHK